MHLKLFTIALLALTISGFRVNTQADDNMTENSQQASQPVIQKKVIIKTDKGDPIDIEKLVEYVKQSLGDEVDIEMLVSADDNPMDIQEMHTPQHPLPPHQIFKFQGAEAMPMRGVHMMHGAMEKMSEGAANCVLKSITKIQTDAAAHLLREACSVLNPVTPGD